MIRVNFICLPTNIHCNRSPNVATNRHLAVGQYICSYLRLYIGLTVQTNRPMQPSPHSKKEPRKLSRYKRKFLYTLIGKPHRCGRLRFPKMKIFITSTDTIRKDEIISRQSSENENGQVLKPARFLARPVQFGSPSLYRMTIGGGVRRGAVALPTSHFLKTAAGYVSSRNARATTISRLYTSVLLPLS